MKKWPSLPWLLVIALAGLLAWLHFTGKIQWGIAKKQADVAVISDSSDMEEPPKERIVNSKQQSIPEYVYEVLLFIKKNDKAPTGYVGGREFKNREKKLPKKSETGETIRYREWDVHPKKDGVNRGAERLITGDNNTAYFTKDHYKTFQEIKE